MDEEPARGGVGERDAHVEHARSGGRESDGDGGAGAELDLTLAVDRDGAALHGDPVRDAGGEVPGTADPDRGDDARRDRGEDRPVRGRGIGQSDDDAVRIGPRDGVQQAGDCLLYTSPSPRD